MSMTIEQAKSEIMQIYGALSPDKQRAIDTVLHTINVREYDKDHIWYKGKQYISLNRFLQVKEPCEDAIGRQDVWFKLTNGAYDGETTEQFIDRIAKEIESMPSVNPQEPSGDLISLETVIEWLKTKDIIKLSSQEETARKELKALPSVNPQPKTGHWIPTYGNVKCSVCGSVKDSMKVGKATHYCDFCGAKMVEPQESEDKGEQI